MQAWAIEILLSVALDLDPEAHWLYLLVSTLVLAEEEALGVSTGRTVEVQVTVEGLFLDIRTDHLDWERHPSLLDRLVDPLTPE